MKTENQFINKLICGLANCKSEQKRKQKDNCVNCPYMNESECIIVLLSDAKNTIENMMDIMLEAQEKTKHVLGKGDCL